MRSQIKVWTSSWTRYAVETSWVWLVQWTLMDIWSLLECPTVLFPNIVNWIERIHQVVSIQVRHISLSLFIVVWRSCVTPLCHGDQWQRYLVTCSLLGIEIWNIWAWSTSWGSIFKVWFSRSALYTFWTNWVRLLGWAQLGIRLFQFDFLLQPLQLSYRSIDH